MTDKNLAIKVESLTKIYPLYKNPKDRLKEALHPRRKKFHEDFYALKDVSFEVEKGDSLGIIGQNGSGKSTLLKIISRVLTASSGSFEVRGRVISLLELGSGFNPELTGMENIYFYGTILGFSKQKIESKLDEIISFADIGQFIYQPLKTYSSGMRSRLAFSVASNVDPDILILDEVLAVGDLRFKQKCFRVMKNIIDQNKTVILVSHDTDAVNRFCNKVLWIDNGKVLEFGQPSEVLKNYVGFMTYGMKQEKVNLKDSSISHSEKKGKPVPGSEQFFENEIIWINTSKFDSFGSNNAKIEKVALYYKDTNKRIETLKGGEWLSLFCIVSAEKVVEKPGLGILVKDRLGNGIFTVNNYQQQIPIKPIGQGEKRIIRTDFKFPLLRSDKYFLTIAFSDGTQENHIQHHWIHDVFVIPLTNNELKFTKGAQVLVIGNDHYALKVVDI